MTVTDNDVFDAYYHYNSSISAFQESEQLPSYPQRIPPLHLSVIIHKKYRKIILF